MRKDFSRKSNGNGSRLSSFHLCKKSDMPESLAARTRSSNEAAPSNARKGLFRRIVHGRAAGNFLALLIVFSFGYAFFVLGLRTFHVPSASMQPTLLEGDQLFTIERETYIRGDIVVIRDHEDGGYIVKRIVGLGGDTLTVKAGALYINGEYASEPYLLEEMEYVFPDPGSATVLPGQAFVLGDNRNKSDDSSVDLITESVEDIVGVVKFIYYPYARFGPVAFYRIPDLGGK